MLREKRVSVLMDVEITKMLGINKLESVHFKHRLDTDLGKKNRNTEFVIKPDIVIAENGLGGPKYDLKSLLVPGNNENGDPPLQLGIGGDGMPASDIRFSLHYNDL